MKFKKVITVSILALAVTTTAGAASITAQVSPHQVYVDGEKANIAAYLIGGNNYYKLRDIAAILSGTDAQLDVAWNGEYNRIDLTDGKAYTPVGGELGLISPGNREAMFSTAIVFKDGMLANYTGFLIGGNNFYKLRDLGEAFDFGVSFDATTRSVLIDSGTEPEPEPEIGESSTIVSTEPEEPDEPERPVEQPEEPDYPDEPYYPEEPEEPEQPAEPEEPAEPEQPSLSDRLDQYERYYDMIMNRISDIRDQGYLYMGPECEYESKVNDLITEIASLQQRADILSLDDSREAQAQRTKVLEELAEQQEKLADLQAAHSRRVQVDSLYKMLDEYRESLGL